MHAVSERMVGVTARIGRSIEGRVFPMLLDVRDLPAGSGPEDIASHFAQFVGRGLMLVGPPNVGKVRSVYLCVCVCVCVCVSVIIFGRYMYPRLFISSSFFLVNLV